MVYLATDIHDGMIYMSLDESSFYEIYSKVFRALMKNYTNK